jgi:hypothetical protein
MTPPGSNDLIMAGELSDGFAQLRRNARLSTHLGNQRMAGAVSFRVMTKSTGVSEPESVARFPYRFPQKQLLPLTTVFGGVVLLAVLSGPSTWVKKQRPFDVRRKPQLANPFVTWGFVSLFFAAFLLLLYLLIMSNRRERAVVFSADSVRFPASLSSRTIVTVPYNSITEFAVESNANGKRCVRIRSTSGSSSIQESGLGTHTLQELEEYLAARTGYTSDSS